MKIGISSGTSTVRFAVVVVTVVGVVVVFTE